MPDTRTGGHYENIIEIGLKNGGLVYAQQQLVGEKPDGGRHKVDFVAWKPGEPGRKILVSCKVQNMGGSAEEKLPYEIIKLLHTMNKQPEYVAAFLILGGMGWSRGIQNFIKVRLKEFVIGADRVTVYTTDEMITGGFLF
jgi:hypothetical protein